MNAAILDNDVQEFIRENPGEDNSRLLFQKQRFPGVEQKELATQLESRKKCRKKLPLWHNTPGIYYPSGLAIEQSSSEITAAYKSELANGERLIDLTGGFGVDSFYFAKRADTVIHCEVNGELSEIAAHNFGILGAENILTLKADGMDVMAKSREHFDTAYLDPSRRAGSSRVFRLSDCTPDVVSHLSLLLQKSGRVLVKTSPLLDLQAGLCELKHVCEIHIVSLKNECKELIWVIERETAAEPVISCAALDVHSASSFEFLLSEERAAVINEWSAPLTWLFEPDAALLKGGCFKLIAIRYGLKKLHQHSHLYTSLTVPQNFVGKVFGILSTASYKDFTRENVVKKANVISRNFPVTAENIRKKHRIKDGGEIYLFFTKTVGEQLIVISARRN